MSTRLKKHRGAGLAPVAAVAALVGLVIAPGAASDGAVAAQTRIVSPATETAARAAFTKTEKISRVNLVNGVTQVVDTRTVSVSVSQTQDLRDRQEISVSWTGAHPTGGIVPQATSTFGALEEYPVVIMMCRGKAAATSGKDVISPETCWTQSPPERVQLGSSLQDPNAAAFPPYRLDLYASAADRAADVGVPNPLPAACEQFAGGTQHWVPFIAADGVQYDYGPQGCAGLPPEASNLENALSPSNTTYGVSNLKGDGSASFTITTAETNASLGCSDTVACSLVIIPIMGISCDPAGASLPPADRPPTPAAQAAALAECSQAGYFGAGNPDLNPSGEVNATNFQQILPVSGELWWSASNWRNRIVAPLTFAPPSNVCKLVSSQTDVQIFGSYFLAGATEQWEPHFCLNSKLFSLEHVFTGEPEAKTLLESGSIDAAFQGASPPTPFTRHVVQAPTAVTGFAIVFDIINKYGQQYTATVRLDARLLAKLLTESYSAGGVGTYDTALQNPATHKPNPQNITDDPEFKALNPGIAKNPLWGDIGDLAGVSASTLLAMSGGSDAMWALTSYINADPEARAWLNGKPDPWGMVVNPAYKRIKLPVSSWPLLDTFVPPTTFLSNNVCLTEDPTPWQTLVAAPVPVTVMSDISLYLQYDYSDSTINCSGGNFPSWVSLGQEVPGDTFILGITSLADAERYGLHTAALETQGGSTSSATFTTSAGRTFASPTSASLRAALGMMKPDDKTGSWPVPYSAMRAEAAGKSAYPGTMLISTDVPTTGLPKTLAHDYGEFLDFVAGPGQHPGAGTGQLPAGYLPMTAANGASKLVSYTRAAAGDVAAQNNKVPSPSHPGVAAGPSSSPAPSPGSSASGSQPTSTGSSGSSSSSPSASPSASTSVRTTSPSPGSTEPVAVTADVRSALSGWLLPLVLLIALIVGTLAVGSWILWRPRASK